MKKISETANGMGESEELENEGRSSNRDVDVSCKFRGSMRDGAM